MMYMLLFIVFIQRTNGCSDGYYGMECKTPCRFPNFGQKCQQQCNCTEDFCNPIKGCITNQGCTDGFFGLKCRDKCRYPSFGKLCQSFCKCEPEHCNPISGCDSFTGCTDGFFGLKCRDKCRYPSFGKLCQSFCKCEPEHCNPISGCDSFTVMVDSGLMTKRTVITHSEESFQERNSYILIGTSVFVVVTILVILVFVVFKRRKSNTINNEEPEFVSEFSSYQSENDAIEQTTSSIHFKNNYLTMEIHVQREM